MCLSWEVAPVANRMPIIPVALASRKSRGSKQPKCVSRDTLGRCIQNALFLN